MPSLSFFFLLMVTFSKWIELIWWILGDEGVAAEKIGRFLCRARSTKEGEEI